MSEEMKSFEYYLLLPIVTLDKSNFIPLNQLDNDLKLGLYYLMDIYDLGFKQCVHGSWEWISLHKDGDSEGLTGEEIQELPFNEEKLKQHKSDFINGIFPEGYNSQETSIQEDEDKYKDFEYKDQFGWLSPTGEFIISDWGTHEISAEQIIKNKGFKEDYKQWSKSDPLELARDYLCTVKGYILIHNPSADGGYVVTNSKPLTKKQKEFLFDYFCAVGNYGRANFYIED